MDQKQLAESAQTVILHFTGKSVCHEEQIIWLQIWQGAIPTQSTLPPKRRACESGVGLYPPET